MINDETAEMSMLDSDDDRGMGLALFLIFSGACLIVTGAVAMIALIDTWWVLGFAFGVHVLMTAAVGLAVFSALSRRAEASRDADREPASMTARVQPPSPGGAAVAHP